MLDKAKRLKKNELNILFINGLGRMVSAHSEKDSAPLLIDLTEPLSLTKIISKNKGKVFTARR